MSISVNFISEPLLSVLITAAILGLSAGLSPGPTLTLVVSESLRYGKIAGFKVAIAPLITDLPIIVCATIFTDLMRGSSVTFGLIAFAGGGYIMWLAVDSFRFKGSTAGGISNDGNSLRKAVVTNALNPHPYLFWGTVGVSALHKALTISATAGVAFVFALYAFIVGSKMLIAAIVSRSRVWLQGTTYVLITKVIGIFLAAFSVVLLVQGWQMLAEK